MTEKTRFEELSTALTELDEPKVNALVDDILTHSPSIEEVDQTFQAIQLGMQQVGSRFQSGEYFLAEMLFAAEVVNQVVPRLTAQFKSSARRSIGRVILCTVHGDIHDIGKNLVSVLLTSVGFEVIDLGIDVSPGRLIAAIKEHQPEIVGLSGLLTLSIDPMKETVEAIKAAGLRDQVKIIIGGNPVTEQVHQAVGSDGWADNAAEGVAQCRQWVEA
jgi:methylmalonyl-CoA mutase cobalamin-binding domain/chain